MPRTIVVKVGTSTLTDAEDRLDREFLAGNTFFGWLRALFFPTTRD